MSLFSLKLFFLPQYRKKFCLAHKDFLVQFRALARRFNACLAEVHRIGVESLDDLGQEVIDEVKAIHERFMEIRLDGLDMDTEIFSKMNDPRYTDTESFAGQWNRVVKFVVLYENMFGQDPELLVEAEACKASQAYLRNFEDSFDRRCLSAATPPLNFGVDGRHESDCLKPRF
jgi:hypothetical protein